MMMTTDCTELEIRKLPEGGYVVADAYRFENNAQFRTMRFASASIGEALKFIEAKMTAVKALGS